MVPPSGSYVARAIVPINAGNINTILESIISVPTHSNLYTVYIVAEGTPGGLQANAEKFYATTQPCPTIDMDFGFQQPLQCINKGVTGTWRYTLYDTDPDLTGVYPNTRYFIDWGDGSTTEWFSTPTELIPPLAVRTHTYTATDNCNYFTFTTVTSSCNPLIVKQFSTYVIVHGRDIDPDGDGNLLISDFPSGTTGEILVCEGMSHTITIQDNSTWNCQAPTFLDGTPAPANTDPRNIQWLYGINPTGGNVNTITGAVAIAGLGDAPQSSARMSPVPYGPSSLSQSITIPATCVAGEYFRVYFKQWNKCNWTDPEYVNTYIDIKVIAKPVAAAGADRSICTGSSTILGAAAVPGSTYSWTSVPVGFTSTQANPTVSPTVNTTYTVTETAANGCINSNSVVVTVNPTSVGGSVGTSTAVCSGSNSTLLTLTGYTGSIVKWQYSTNNWATAIDIANTTDTYTATNLTTIKRTSCGM